VVREAVERGRGCRGELGLAELIEREPLTEEAARREMIADRREVLARVERSGAGLPRYEEVRDDRIEALAREPQEVARVVEHDARARIAIDAAVRVPEPALGRRRDARHQLDQEERIDRMRERAARADAGRRAGVRDAPGVRREHERQMTTPLGM